MADEGCIEGLCFECIYIFSLIQGKKSQKQEQNSSTSQQNILALKLHCRRSKLNFFLKQLRTEQLEQPVTCYIPCSGSGDEEMDIYDNDEDDDDSDRGIEVDDEEETEEAMTDVKGDGSSTGT